MLSTQIEHCLKGFWSSGGAGLPQPQHGCSRSFRESESASNAAVGAAAAGAAAELELDAIVHGDGL